LLDTRLFDTWLFDTWLHRTWLFNPRAFDIALAVHRSLALFRLPLCGLPNRIQLALGPLTFLLLLFAQCLRLLALLARLLVPLLPALRNRGFALLTLFNLAPLMLGLALLPLTYLPIAILSDSLGQRMPIEYRALCGRRRFARRPFDSRRAIRSIANDGRSSIAVVLVLASVLRGEALPLRCPRQFPVCRRAPHETRYRRRRIAPHDDLATLY
jgi:hypothetical protein